MNGKEHRNVRCAQHTTADGDGASYRSHLSVASRLLTLLLSRNEGDIVRKEGSMRIPASAKLKLEIILH